VDRTRPCQRPDRTILGIFLIAADRCPGTGHHRKYSSTHLDGTAGALTKSVLSASSVVIQHRDLFVARARCQAVVHGARPRTPGVPGSPINHAAACYPIREKL